MEIVGLLLILLGGGLNLFERLVYGYVNDYWNFLGTGIYNNINDWLISIGIILFIWVTIKQKKQSK
jgi:lipoprotein signal peptidase